MKSCPNCGWSNDEGNRFCENCGADLQVLKAASQQPGWPQTPPASAWETAPSELDWRMSPLPEEEVAPPKRRTWIWIVVGALVLCLGLCVVGFGWLEYTGSGKDFQTRIAEEATSAADE